MKTIHNVEKQIKVKIIKVSNNPFYSMEYSGDYCFEEYLERGASNIDEFATFMNNTLISEGKKFENPIDFGCSVFVAHNSDGDVIVARNMDCECAIPMMIRINEGDRYKTLAMLNMAELDWDENTYDALAVDAKLTLAAPYSPSDGINEQGLAVTIMTDVHALYPSDRSITLFDETLPRLMLDRAKNVEEAIEYAGKYNFFCTVSPLHYMVADATGNSAVIEFVDGKMEVTRKYKNYQIATNFTLYNNPNHEGFGKDRYEAIDKELEKCNGIISEMDALALLKENVIPGDEQWSVIYNLTQKRVRITFPNDNQSVYNYKL